MCNSIPQEYPLDDIAKLKLLNKARAQDDALDERTTLKRLVYRSGNLDDIAKLKMLAQENLPDDAAHLKEFSSKPQDNFDEIAKLKMLAQENLPDEAANLNMFSSRPQDNLDEIAKLKMLAQENLPDEAAHLKEFSSKPQDNFDEIAKLKMLAQENLPDDAANLKMFSSGPQDNLDKIAKLKMLNSTNQNNLLGAAVEETSMITEQSLTKEHQQFLEQTKLMKCEQRDTQQMISTVAKRPLQDSSQIPSDILQMASLGAMATYDDVKLQPQFTTVYNITGVNGDTSENSVWRNIMNQTQNLIDSYDTGSYVSTYAEIHVTRRLHHHGAVFVTGRPGTGKSRISHHVLQHIAKTSQRKPLILTSAHDWNVIPKSSPSGDEKSRCEEFVVMVDDIFGQSDLNERFLDDWERMFELMWPSVESGQILLLLTSRTDISGACQARLLRYQLFKNIKIVELGEGQFALKLNEKATFWSKLCGRLGLPEDAIVEICNMNTFLGFPKCCTLFASTKGVRKYGCAYDFLATDVKTLKGNDKVGYFVLLLILVTDGLDKKRLDRPTREFKDEIETLADTCMNFTPNCKMIKDKLEQFCGIYLTRKCYKYTFKNMFAFNAAFLEFAPTHLDMLLPVCPASTLVRIIRTAPHQLGTSTVSLTEDLYDEFVKHILCTLQQGDRDILDHPCFHEDRFISLLIEQTDADSAREIATKDLGAATVDIPIFSLDPMLSTSTSELLTCLSYMFRSETIIRYSYQLSFMIMKGLVGLVKLLLDQLSDTMSKSILSESLTCAVYTNASTTVTMLLDKGASPTADTLAALCSVSDRDVIFMDKVLGLLDMGSVQDARKLTSLAMQCGNFRVANMLIKELITSGQIIASCLIQPLYQHSGLFKEGSGHQATDLDLQQLMIPLLDTRCSYDYHLLVCLAAGHRSPVALQLLLSSPQLPAFTKDQVHEQAKHAALYGSFQCLQEHLHRNKQTSSSSDIGVTRETLLHYSARSTRDSNLKINLLANSPKEGYGVNVIDKYGNTPLHFAALLGDSKSVQTLLDLGADPEVVNAWGVSPIHCAAVSGSLESVNALKTDQKIVESNAIFKYCFHDPTRNELLDSYLMHYEDFQILRSIPSDSFVRSSIGVLIEAGFNINETEENGQTALFHACRSNQLRLVTFLCRKGADVRATDLDGRTVLHEAFKFAGMDLVRMLRAKKLRVDAKDGKGESMIHAAAGSTTEAVQKLQYLLEEEKVPLEEDHAERTVLFPAVEMGDSGVVEFLIDKGVDVRKPDNHGVTLAQLAREKNHENLLANVFKDL